MLLLFKILLVFSIALILVVHVAVISLIMLGVVTQND